MRCGFLALIAIFVAAETGCSPFSKGSMPWWPWRADETATVPDWVVTPPQPSKTTLFAVGTSGRTQIPERGKDHAIAVARHDLAGNLRVHVQSLSGEVVTADGNDFAKVTTTDINDTLESSIVRSVWYDKDGLAGPKGTHYALVEVDFADLVKANQ